MKTKEIKKHEHPMLSLICKNLSEIDMKVKEQLLRIGKGIRREGQPGNKIRKVDVHSECIVYGCEGYPIVQNYEMLINTC